MLGGLVCAAFAAATAVGSDVFCHIFLSVVISQFRAWFDRTDGVNVDVASFYPRFAVGVAGMVKVAGQVFSSFAVNGKARV